MWLLAPSAALLLAAVCAARVVDFEKDAGAVPEKNDSATMWKNGGLLNATLKSLRPGDTLVVPNKTFHLIGGIHVDGLKSVVIRIDGTLAYSDDMSQWPRLAQKGGDGKGQVLECWFGSHWENVTFTSSGTGTMDGNGARWWGPPGIGYLEHHENRPRLLSLDGAKGLLFENIVMKNSPYWTFWISNVDGLEVRRCHIDARRTDKDGHGIIDITAFNTDGYDVTGRNVWIHDSSVWNQDDCIAVKDGSENMLFERIEASGLGLTIGSIGGSTVRNITFRDIHMHRTVKGIYTKFRGPGAIEDVTFENIVIEKPSQYGIWIGPAQQSDSSSLCAPHPCSLCWPQLPGSRCDVPANATYRNIVLRNITINSPTQSPGVILANASSPMQGLVFEDVRVNHPGSSPFGEGYKCENAVGVARGSTWPVPACLKDETGTCVADGTCAAAGRSCCSGRAHRTANCAGTGSRCGCVAPGSCADSSTDCCGGKCHRTAACGLGIACRCDAGTGLFV